MMVRLLMFLFVMAQSSILLAGSDTLRFGLVEFQLYEDGHSSYERNYLNDYLNLVFKKAEINGIIEYLPPVRLVNDLKKREIDATFLTDKRADTLKHLLYIGKPVFVVDVGLYQNLSTEVRVENPDRDLINKEIILPKESRDFFSSIVPGQNTFIEVATPRNLAIMFINKRADYMIDYTQRAGFNFLHLNKPDFKYQMLILKSLNVHLVINKGVQGAKILLQKFDQEFNGLRLSHEEEKIFKKYGVRLKFAD